MASPTKRLHLALETPDTTESSSNSDDSGDSDEEDNNSTAEEIQVEFEARTPEECDFDGIKRCLQKLFRPGGGNSSINISAVAEFVIGQRNVGSVITQSRGGAGGADSDDDDDFDGENEVFGVTTVLKLTQNDSALAREIKDYLLRLSKNELATFFANPNYSVGFLISERIMNIPPQISVPLYETLFNEIRKARAKNCPFDFTHYVLLSKCLRSTSGGNGVAPAAGGPSLVFVNAEEEMLEEESEVVVDVESSQPNGSSGGEGEGQAKVFDLSESEYESSSKIMIINAGKTERILSLLKNLFPI